MPPKSRAYQVSATPITIFAHLLFICITTLVLVWLLHFRGGFAFSSTNKAKIFNLHVFFMAIGFILFAGEAIMAYKSVPGDRKAQKLVHLVLHLIALACGIVGIIAVFKFHNELGYAHMYTLHSWLGMATICLFGFQLLLGFFSFFFPGAEKPVRARLAPWHVFMGITIFLIGIAAALTGISQKFIFLGLEREQEAYIVNFTGILILLFGITVALGVVLPRGYY
ncbi:Cytochrome b561/ferric reductase transmembrane [Dillenia turbinata]|uniref:ascorbate ferrireductase (transmembrane) n=1 Tax=Dillenia turbinata TaxID=194707 RepID=A0AAN8VHA4_9MAGN